MMSRRTTILASTLLLVGAAVAVWFLFWALYDRIGGKQIDPVSYKAPLVISVQAAYPGANAQTLADTVAGPIEQQINGVEHMLSMSSQSSNDGSYTLNITFEAGTDLDMAQVLVQNRASLAVPVLPTHVQLTGISVRKKSPEPLVLVSLTSPDNRHDVLFLSKYATSHVKDELARLPGVGDIALFGQRDYQMRVVLDADKLAARQLSALDVVTAINQQNIQVAAGVIGQPPLPKGQQLQLTINTVGRLADVEQLESLIVKTTPDGGTVRLKDLASIKLGSTDSSNASLNGKPTVMLSIHPLPNARPSDVSRAVLDKLAELRAEVSDGLTLAVAFDFALNLEEPNNPAAPEHLVIDAELPESASVERTTHVLERAGALLRKTAGVQDVLALTEHPFSLVRNRPCLVVRLTPKDQRQLGREKVAGDVRLALQNQIPEAVFRLSVPSTAEGFPVYGFPIEFAVEDHGDHGTAFIRERSAALVEKMSQSGKFSDAGVGPGSRGVPVLTVDIDRTKCQALGVEMNDLFNTLQVYLGTHQVNNLNQLERTLQMTVQAEPRFRARATDILNLEVKNKQNDRVRLGHVMDVREATGPMVIERHNLYPIARITANLAEGVPPADARLLCRSLVEQEFGAKQFKLIWQAR